MRRILLATTAISALVLAPALGLAQAQSNGPNQEQPRDQEKVTPKGGNQVKPTQGQTAPGKSAQSQTPKQSEQPQRLQGQAQPEPQGKTGQQHLQGQAQPKGQENMQGQAQPKSQERVQGQAQPRGQERMQGQAQVQGQAQQPAGTTQRSTGTAEPSGGARGGQVQVTQQQRTQIHERLTHVRVERIEHPQFSVSVGVVIPRSVRIEVLPPEIVEIVPEYQGFDYVMVGNEILIVDPISLQIVAVIPA